MKINALIDRNFTTTSVLDDTRDVSTYLNDVDYLAVMDEELQTTGIITLKDLHTHPESRNVLDCPIEKPKLSPGQTIFEVFRIMQETGFDFLPVYENERFIGVISLLNITAKFAQSLTDSQQNYQKVVHDLRNPIGNLKGFFELLKSPLAEPEKQELIRLCGLSCEHAIDILDDLVSIEVEDNRPLVKEPTDMNDFFKQCVSGQTGLRLLKNIKLEEKLSRKKVSREVDPTQLKRAIQNVIGNAVKFSYPNSTIKISSKCDGTQIVLTIEDEGIGIPEKYQSEIFNRFTPAGRPGTSGEPSTGLGLCFTKQCIEQHGGQIYFKSSENKGTTFYIRL